MKIVVFDKYHKSLPNTMRRWGRASEVVISLHDICLRERCDHESESSERKLDSVLGMFSENTSEEGGDCIEDLT